FNEDKFELDVLGMAENLHNSDFEFNLSILNQSTSQNISITITNSLDK
ncbi:1645_t:CDS:1, partial [Dentiscutata heterogama]